MANKIAEAVVVGLLGISTLAAVTALALKKSGAKLPWEK